MTASIATTRVRGLAQSPRTNDLFVTLLAFALTLVLLNGIDSASRQLDALGVALAGLSCFPLLIRRRFPLAVFAVTTAATATLNALGYGLGPPFGPTVALFFVATDERTRVRFRQTALVVLGFFAVHVGSTVVSHHTFPTSPILFGVLVWGAAWVAGDQLRHRRRRHAELRERASQAEREIGRERRLAAAEERTRIARDLHDSAAHAINVILVQAGAARLLQHQDPQATHDALTTIEDVARETIGEIDQLVRTLRDDNGRTTIPEAVEPPAGLAAFETLANRHRAAGLSLEIRVQGTQRSLAPGFDQAAYRILQESLTNAARHGDGNAEVEIAYRADRLELTVSNLARPDSGIDTVEGGHGILGMRERAALLGGTLDAVHVDGHFQVEARLPYPGEQP